MWMKTAVIYTGVFLLLCYYVPATGNHLSSPYSNKDLSNLKVLLERYFENLGEEEPAENMAEYDVASQDLDNQASSSWDREKEKEGQWNMGDSRKPFDGYKSDSSRLRDLLLAPRNSRGTSGCFGSRIDRIGSSSSLGCGGMKKG
uniref:Atrial natriuretic peptide n=1 Tax=Polypterus endlicherii TaxID=348150 RepID=Q1XGZ2_9ACTI|nr:atrial natriuretic peptide [Polypterus endlicherii]